MSKIQYSNMIDLVGLLLVGGAIYSGEGLSELSIIKIHLLPDCCGDLDTSYDSVKDNLYW